MASIALSGSQNHTLRKSQIEKSGREPDTRFDVISRRKMCISHTDARLLRLPDAAERLAP